MNESKNYLAGSRCDLNTKMELTFPGDEPCHDSHDTPVQQKKRIWCAILVKKDDVWKFGLVHEMSVYEYEEGKAKEGWIS